MSEPKTFNDLSPNQQAMMQDISQDLSVALGGGYLTATEAAEVLEMMARELREGDPDGDTDRNRQEAL